MLLSSKIPSLGKLRLSRSFPWEHYENSSIRAVPLLTCDNRVTTTFAHAAGSKWADPYSVDKACGPTRQSLTTKRNYWFHTELKGQLPRILLCWTTQQIKDKNSLAQSQVLIKMTSVKFFYTHTQVTLSSPSSLCFHVEDNPEFCQMSRTVFQRPSQY